MLDVGGLQVDANVLNEGQGSKPGGALLCHPGNGTILRRRCARGVFWTGRDGPVVRDAVHPIQGRSHRVLVDMV